MLTTILTTAASVVTFVSIVVLGNNSVSHISVTQNQSTTSATPTPIANMSASPTPRPVDEGKIREEIQEKIDQATASAKAQMGSQRQAALDQIEQQFDEAAQQLEDAILQFPVIEGQPNPMDQAQQQLSEQKQQAIDTINQTMQWPL